MTTTNQTISEAKNRIQDALHPVAKEGWYKSAWSEVEKALTDIAEQAREEGYVKGQDDAFRGEIENMTSVVVKETYEVPEHLREYFRKEGANAAVEGLSDDWDFRVRLARAVMEKYHNVPKTGSFFFDDIDAQEVLEEAITRTTT